MNSGLVLAVLSLSSCSCRKAHHFLLIHRPFSTCSRPNKQQVRPRLTTKTRTTPKMTTNKTPMLLIPSQFLDSSSSITPKQPHRAQSFNNAATEVSHNTCTECNHISFPPHHHGAEKHIEGVLFLSKKVVTARKPLVHFAK